MPAAAIPAIYAGGAIGSGILSYMSSRKTSKLSPVEQHAQQTQVGAADSLSQQGTQLSQYGMPKLQQAGSYFSKLAAGDRGTTSQALAPDVEHINATYGGTQRTLQRFLRGADRDYQTGELARQRAGAIGSLFTGARARGTEGLVNLGQYGVSQGASALGGAAGVAGNVGAAGMQNRFAGANLQRQAGSDTASLIFQLLKSGAFKWGAAGGGAGGAGMTAPGNGGDYGGYG